jgi:nitroreductase
VHLDKVMRTTAATRRYTSQPVDDEALHRVLDAARFAPSGGNRQPWRVIVVRDQAQKRRLREQYVLGYEQTAARAGRGTDAFAEHLDDVPVLLVICVELNSLRITDGDLGRPSIVGGASIYPFVQNILLALRDEGLGGLLTTVVCSREGDVREIFGIPDGFAVACVIPVGQPVRRAPVLRRNPVEEFARLDRFDGTPLVGPATE